MSWRPQTVQPFRQRVLGRRFWRVFVLPQHVVDVKEFRMRQGTPTSLDGEFDFVQWLRSNVKEFCVVEEIPAWRMLSRGDDSTTVGMIRHMEQLLDSMNHKSILRFSFTGRDDALLFRMSLP